MTSTSSSSSYFPLMGSSSSCTSIGASNTSKIMKSTDTKQQNTIHPILHRLQQNDTSLTSLLILDNGKPTKKSTVYYRPRNIQDWELLGQALATNTNLIRLDVKLAAQQTHHNSSQQQTLNAFYTQLNKNRSIRRLSFNGVELQDGRLFSQHLLQFFQNNTKLTSLSATHQSLGGFAGSNQLSSILTTKPTSLKYLDLSYTGMNDEECRMLCLAIESHHLGLRSLELNGNRLKHDGCAAIATLLANQNCILNRLCLENNRITDQGARALSDGLINNGHLKTLLLDNNATMSSSGIMNSLMKVVCNFSNVNDIMNNSNHTLQTLALPSTYRATLHQNLGLYNKCKLSMQYSLRFNHRGSSNHVSSSNNGSSNNKVSYIINQKVVLHHFIFNANIQLYEELPGHLLPRLLSSIANYEVYNHKRSDKFASKDELFAKKDYNRRHVELHRLIRLCPSICERWVGSSNVESQVEGAENNSIKPMRLS